MQLNHNKSSFCNKKVDDNKKPLKCFGITVIFKSIFEKQMKNKRTHFCSQLLFNLFKLVRLERSSGTRITLGKFDSAVKVAGS